MRQSPVGRGRGRDRVVRWIENKDWGAGSHRSWLCLISCGNPRRRTGEQHFEVPG